MLTVRRAEDSDLLQWDTFVQSHKDGGPYHLFAWKMAVENAYYHEPYYLMAEDSGGRIQGILPLIYMKVPFLKRVFVSLPFCDYGGILAQSAEASDSLLSKASDLAITHKAELDIRCKYSESALQNSPSFNVTTYKSRMLLDLPESPDALWKTFKSKLRSQIKKPQKEGLRFEIGSTEKIDQFYRVFTRNMRDLGSPVHARKWIESVVNAFEGKGHVGIVYKENFPIAAGIVLNCRDTVSIPWASTLRDYNHFSPNMLLYWGFLEYACNNGFKSFDFGRSTPDEGTYRFKEQWGAKPQPLFWYMKGANNHAQPQSVSSNGRARRMIEKAWSQLPQAITNIIGPVVRRFISL